MAGIATATRWRRTCGQCGGPIGAPGDDLMPGLRELVSPVTAAGPVRGEDYDEGRFALRQLCCPHCGALVDVQVAQDGVAPPRLAFTFS